MQPTINCFSLTQNHVFNRGGNLRADEKFVQQALQNSKSLFVPFHDLKPLSTINNKHASVCWKTYSDVKKYLETKSQYVLLGWFESDKIAR